MTEEQWPYMTEEKWLGCGYPGPMIESLRGKAGQRKLRLFIVACCRRLLRDSFPEFADCLRVAEDLADRRATDEEVRGAWGLAEASGEQGYTCWKAVECAFFADPATPWEYDLLAPVGGCDQTLRALLHAAEWAEFPEDEDNGLDDPEEMPTRQVELVRDIFGNPFRPAALDLAWRTPTVMSLAQATYDERTLPSGELDPARLAVLADALEEAGCDSADILCHLRSPGPHVRGCWALDLVLGKS